MSVASVSELTTPRPELDREAFLNLLVTQLQHQDPLDPMDQTEFITQLAQLQAVQEAIELNRGVQQLIGMQEWTHTLGLLGRHVTALHPETGEPISGVVEGVDLGAGPPGFVVNGLRLRLEDILVITD